MKTLWILIFIAIVAASMLASCVTGHKYKSHIGPFRPAAVEPGHRVIDGYKISSSGWLYDVNAEDHPGCDWLLKHKVYGIEPLDTYEITTEEWCTDW